MGLLSRGIIILLCLVTLTRTEDLAVAQTTADVKKSEPLKVFDINSEKESLESEDLLNVPAPRLHAASSRTYDFTNYDSLRERYGPQDPPSTSLVNPYVISEARLREIRAQFMYWFFDQGGPNDEGDLQRDIHHSNPQIHKNFNFQLPFYGSRFNYTRVSLNGYLEFSDPPPSYTYPLSFPVKEWPNVRDPAFIGIFFSKCRIGVAAPDDDDQRSAGVYFRLERDLQSRTDMFGVEVRERLMWDIREGVVGSDTFVPKHAAIITWKNITFSGGIDNSRYKTNTFQMVLATDEVYTYAIFNYKELRWTSHTEAGGDTTNGEGGVPAFVGFNAGNGTGSVEYKPYSQASVIRDLSGRGWANGFPGRHIFRLDEKIMLGTCNKDVSGTNLPLVFAPESGNMLGGTVVNITGPCFEPNMRIRCKFDTEEVIGTYVDRNRALCVQPYLNAEGYIRFEVSVGDNAFNWKGKYFVETPATAKENIMFQTNDVHLRDPNEIQITWVKSNLTTNTAAQLTISLYGYKETTIRPELLFIDILETGVPNLGTYTIIPSAYKLRSNSYELQELQYGFLKINLTNPDTYSGLKISPVLWSKPIPLGWYFNGQWERRFGIKWPEALCDQWLIHDRYLKNFAAEIPVCPCTLEHALTDKGRFLPDAGCDKDINSDCFYHKGAVHCVKSGAPSQEGSEQQCCYDRENKLMMSYDQQWGSRPRRAHNLGFLPWNEANKVPTLSQWFHDIIPYYSCCLWQDEQAVGCETFRFERRPSQDCVAYQSPYVATVFGDPHVITFDNVEYTFNGKGEFILVQANQGKEMLNIQGRFEQMPGNIYGDVMATQLTSIVAQDNSSAIVEVRLRPNHAQWRYHLDVLVDKRKVYFDRPALRMQHFPGVTIYTPTVTIDQSQVVIMFPSGAGVEVVESKGFMAGRVYLPWTFMNKTRGLFGNWSFDITDEFVLPTGELAGVSNNYNSFENLHKNFALKWLLEEGDEANKGQALFSRDNGRPSSFYTNKTFIPEYRGDPEQFVPPNRTFIIQKAKDLCGQSYQCKYDYAMSLNTDMALQTLKFREEYVAIRKQNEKTTTSCGVLETPRFGRKSNFHFVPGTKVTFECNQDFILVGDKRRTCMAEGYWDVPEYGYTECLRKIEYEQQTGWFAIGIIAAVMIPLLLGMLCFAYYYKKKHPKALDTWDRIKNVPFYKTKPRSWDNSSIFTPSKPERKEDPKTFNRTYLTDEPVPNKPITDFKGGDLAEVNDDDEKKMWKQADSRNGSNSGDSENSSSDEDTLPNVDRKALVGRESMKAVNQLENGEEPKRSRSASKLSTDTPSKNSSKPSSSMSSSKNSSKSSRKASPVNATPPPPPTSPPPINQPIYAKPLKLEQNQAGTTSDSSDSSRNYKSLSSEPASPVPAFVQPDRFKRDSSSEIDGSDTSIDVSIPESMPLVSISPQTKSNSPKTAQSDKSGFQRTPESSARSSDSSKANTRQTAI